jgi:hypothetical protein
MRITLSLVVLALAGTLAAVALASRKPDADEAVAITKAFKTTTKAGLNRLAKQFNVVNIRVSTVNPRYARGSFVAKPKYRKVFQAGYGVAKYSKATGWRAYAVGSSGVGCGKPTVPKAVRKDLKLNCP